MKLTGFSRSLQNYIKRLPIKLPLNAKILDAGCGTGILGISIKKCFPKSIVLATDLEKKFLTKIQNNIQKYGFPKDEFNLGIANINSPEKVSLINKKDNLYLSPETFDVVIIGAVLGYSTNPKQSLIRLLKLVKKGGYFIDIEMSENPIGKIISALFKYKNPGIMNIVKILNNNNCVVKKIPFLFTELPGGVSRIGIIASKTN